MPEAPLRERIAAAEARLTTAERKVAAHVAADLAGIPGRSLADLAHGAGVSEPTVLRFCRALGLDGYSGLRMQVVREAAAPPAPVQRAIAPGLPASEAAGAVLDNAVASLGALRRRLDGEAVARAALALLRASRLEIWACGASFAAARHLEAGLMGLCRGVVARDDGAMQATAAATLEGDAVAICLSRSGAARDVVEAARLAAEAGATVVVIAPPGSPLAAAATLTIPCAAQEDGVAGSPAVLVQLVLAEALLAAAGLLAPPSAAARDGRLAAARRARRIES